MSRSSLPRSKRQYVQGTNDSLHRKARTTRGVKSSIFPEFIEPSLATLADRAPSGGDWIHEIKFDGYRFQCHIHAGEPRFYTRRGHDWTARLGVLPKALNPLSQQALILDGEVVVETEEGLSDFHALEIELKRRGGSRRLLFHVFDLLYFSSFDLRGVALIERKEILADVLKNIEPPVLYSQHIDAAEASGPTVWKNACRMQLEGIVSKRRNGRYVSGRSDNWLKTTCHHRDTFVVLGWANKNGRFDGLYVGQEQDDGMHYAGKIEHGITEADQRLLRQRFAKIEARRKPAIKSARKSFPKARWVEPRVLIDAEFRGRTGDGLLRHSSFKGVREDLMQRKQ